MLLPLTTTLPKDPLFSKLLETATQRGDQIIVDDCSRGTQFGYRHILHGIVTLQQKLQGLLDRPIRENRGGFFVALLAPNGYEFIVGTLAVLALGGVVVPTRESPSQRLCFSCLTAVLNHNSDRGTSSRSVAHPAAVRCMLSSVWPGASRARYADPRGSQDSFSCD